MISILRLGIDYGGEFTGIAVAYIRSNNVLYAKAVRMQSDLPDKSVQRRALRSMRRSRTLRMEDCDIGLQVLSAGTRNQELMFTGWNIAGMSNRWAGASGLSPSKISDFKIQAQKTKAGAAGPDHEHDISRQTSLLNTFLTLWDGLKRLVGPTALRRGLVVTKPSTSGGGPG